MKAAIFFLFTTFISIACLEDSLGFQTSIDLVHDRFRCMGIILLVLFCADEETGSEAG